MNLIFFLFFIVGFLFALFGGGGSVLTIPILMFFFETTFNEATIYSLIIIFFISLLTSIENIANRLIPFNSLVLFGASSIFGVIIGRNFLFTLFPEKLSIILFISIMFLSAFLILKKNSKLSFSLSRQSVIFQGLIVGLLTSLLGIGGGFIIVPTLIIFQGMNIKQAVRCALFLMLLNSSFAIIIDFYNNYFYIRIDLLIPMILFSIFGMLFGEWIMNKIKIKLLTKTFSLLLIIMGIFLFFSLF